MSNFYFYFFFPFSLKTLKLFVSNTKSIDKIILCLLHFQAFLINCNGHYRLSSDSLTLTLLFYIFDKINQNNKFYFFYFKKLYLRKGSCGE